MPWSSEPHGLPQPARPPASTRPRPAEECVWPAQGTFCHFPGHIFELSFLSLSLKQGLGPRKWFRGGSRKLMLGWRAPAPWGRSPCPPGPRAPVWEEALRGALLCTSSSARLSHFQQLVFSVLSCLSYIQPTARSPGFAPVVLPT